MLNKSYAEESQNAVHVIMKRNVRMRDEMQYMSSKCKGNLNNGMEN